MNRHPVLTGSLCLIMLCVVCQAGIRASGPYCGVVIFDRWGGCTLYSGIYLMYVSESVKTGLQSYQGQAVQIDAKEVVQPMNPGDGLIKRFEYLGAAPDGRRDWVRLQGVRLTSSVRTESDGKPVATLMIENTNPAVVKVLSSELAFTLLMKRPEHNPWAVSDGPSFALITRLDLGGGDARLNGQGVAAGVPYAWTIRKQDMLPSELPLQPGETKVIQVRFDLPDGQYDFLGGYGGGVHETKCIASNLSAFDIERGKAKVANVTRR